MPGRCFRCAEPALVSHIEEDAAAIGRHAEATAADELRNASAQKAGAPTGESRPDAGKLHPKLRTLLGGVGPEERRVKRFLSRNRFPLVERDAVTFVFHGEADAVYLHHFMRGVPGGLPFEGIDGTSLWHLRLPVPKGSRFEYKFDVVRNGAGGWIDDPLNPCHATDPFGANSVGKSYGYAPPAWTQPDPGAPAGRIERLAIESRAFGESREIGVYLPAGFANDGFYPAVILHDGRDFVNHAGLTTALDNLIHRGEAPPLVAVLVDPGERNGEYTGDPRHAAFVTEEVLPLVRRRFLIRPEPESCVLMGSSLGAVASLATAFRYPGVYGALALMSGSFILDRKLLEHRDPLFERVADLLELVSGDPARLPRRIFVGCGFYEGLIGQNRAFARFLSEHGAEVRFLETRDGHHWQNWRDQLHAALTWTLPREP
jgi:enterochelin esterase family protein